MPIIIGWCRVLGGQCLFDGINCGLLGLPRAVLPLDVWCIQTIETIDLYVKMSSSLKLIMQGGLLDVCLD